MSSYGALGRRLVPFRAGRLQALSDCRHLFLTRQSATHGYAREARLLIGGTEPMGFGKKEGVAAWVSGLTTIRICVGSALKHCELGHVRSPPRKSLALRHQPYCSRGRLRQQATGERPPWASRRAQTCEDKRSRSRDRRWAQTLRRRPLGRPSRRVCAAWPTGDDFKANCALLVGRRKMDF